MSINTTLKRLRSKTWSTLVKYFGARRENEASFEDTHLRQVDYAEATSAPFAPTLSPEAAVRTFVSSVTETTLGVNLQFRPKFLWNCIPLRGDHIWPGVFPYELRFLESREGKVTSMTHDFYVRQWAHSYFRYHMWLRLGVEPVGVSLQNMATELQWVADFLSKSPTKWKGCEFFTTELHNDLQGLVNAMLRSVWDKLSPALEISVEGPHRSADYLDLQLRGDLQRAQTFITALLLNVGLIVEVYLQVNGSTE